MEGCREIMIVAYGAREKNHLELTTFDHTQYRKVGKDIETIALGEKLNIEQKVKNCTPADSLSTATAIDGFIENYGIKMKFVNKCNRFKSTIPCLLRFIDYK